jgi:hypothetical protein
MAKIKRRNISKGQVQKRLTVVECWLAQGQEPDEKMQPILWTEWSTGAFMGAGLLWPSKRTRDQIKSANDGVNSC